MINLAFEAANQYKDKKLDVLNLIWAGVGGAINGGAAATGGGVICQSLVNRVLGLAGGVFEELRDDSKKSVFSVVIKLAGSTALGVFTGALGGKGIRAKGSPYRQVLDTRQEIFRNSVESYE